MKLKDLPLRVQRLAREEEKLQWRAGSLNNQEILLTDMFTYNYSRQDEDDIWYYAEDGDFSWLEERCITNWYDMRETKDSKFISYV